MVPPLTPGIKSLVPMIKPRYIFFQFILQVSFNNARFSSLAYHTKYMYPMYMYNLLIYSFYHKKGIETFLSLYLFYLYIDYSSILMNKSPSATSVVTFP